MSRSGADDQRGTEPDQCRYCPNDADRDEAGHLHCIECGWTDNPGKIVGLHETIDRLRAELAETRDRRDYLQGQLDIIYDAEYSRNDALKRRIEKMTAELDELHHANQQVVGIVEDLTTAGDALADAADRVQFVHNTSPELGTLYRAERAWRSARGDAPTQPPADDGPDTELAAAIAYFEEFDPRVALTPRYLVHDALLHAATIVRAYLARPAVARTDGQPPADDAADWERLPVLDHDHGDLDAGGNCRDSECGYNSDIERWGRQ